MRAKLVYIIWTLDVLINVKYIHAIYLSERRANRELEKLGKKWGFVYSLEVKEVG